MKSPWFVAAFVTCLVCSSATAQPGGTQAKVDLAEKLSIPFSNDKAFSEVPLEAALELISLRTNAPILFDPLLKQHAPDTLFPQEPVSLPELKDVRLAAVFNMLLEPLGLTYLVTPDHLLITTPDLAAARSGLDRAEIARSGSRTDVPPAQPVLAQVSANKKPLADVLLDLAELTGRTIVLSPLAGNSSATSITVTIRNAAVDDAVAVVADMVGLAVVKQGSILYVTTPEKAKEWKEREEATDTIQTLRQREEALLAYLRQMDAQVRALDAARREQEARIRAMIAEAQKDVGEAPKDEPTEELKDQGEEGLKAEGELIPPPVEQDKK